MCACVKVPGHVYVYVQGHYQHVCMRVCVYACMCVCVYVCMCRVTINAPDGKSALHCCMWYHPTLLPTPYTLYILHPTPSNPTPYTLHPTPCMRDARGPEVIGRRSSFVAPYPCPLPCLGLFLCPTFARAAPNLNTSTFNDGPPNPNPHPPTLNSNPLTALGAKVGCWYRSASIGLSTVYRATASCLPHRFSPPTPI
jgi:hypothetical protein